MADKKKAQKKRNTEQDNKELYRVMYVFVGLFLILAGYLSYFLIAESKDIINNPYNLRLSNLSKKIIRGQIVANQGEILAETILLEDGTETRNYPYENLFAHAVGYSQQGKTGIEELEDYSLLTSDIPFYEKIYYEFLGEKNPGNQVKTTLDVKLQAVAYEALGNHNGAVVVLEPGTGKILAMVSKPDYNPNQIKEIWSELTDEDSNNSSLLNRATQGLYPPGSTFKILTALEYIRENPNTYQEYEFKCTGSFELDHARINCYNKKAHGEEDLMKSFAKSCNASFANIGAELDISKFQSLCNTFLFNAALPIPYTYYPSNFQLTEDSPVWEILQSAIGQGKTEITPMHNAMITAAIANGGVLMKPYVIDSILTTYGGTVKKYLPKVYKELMTTEEAKLLSDFMTECVTSGTATELINNSYTAAGKTGTAEWDEHKKPHAWFVGFAPVENPQIVVSIIVEESGTGSKYAVPIAKKIFDAYFN